MHLAHMSLCTHDTHAADTCPSDLNSLTRHICHPYHVATTIGTLTLRKRHLIMRQRMRLHTFQVPHRVAQAAKTPHAWSTPLQLPPEASDAAHILKM